MKVHAQKTVECFGCDRRFNATSAMVLHLEQGGVCPSGAGLDLVSQTAMQFRPLYPSGDDYYLFKCPSCNTGFRFVSAVLQHLESEACDGSLGLLHFFLLYLKNKVYRGY